MMLSLFVPLLMIGMVSGGITLPTSTHLPTTTVENLQRFLHQDQGSNTFLRDLHGNIGAFYVTNLGKTFSNSVQRFQSSCPDCLSAESGLLEKLMPDGSKRRTFATGNGIYPDCVRKDAEVISETFSLVENLVSRLVQRVSGFQDSYRLHGENYTLAESPHKDHLHVYSKPDNQSAPKDHYLVPYHIDNGMFLIITSFDNPSLEVKLRNGEKVTTGEVGSDFVIVLMGRGLTEWLLPQGQVKETLTIMFQQMDEILQLA